MMGQISPVFSHNKFVLLSSLQKDSSIGSSCHKHSSLSVNTKGVDGKGRGGAHGQGPKATTF